MVSEFYIYQELLLCGGGEHQKSNDLQKLDIFYLYNQRIFCAIILHSTLLFMLVKNEAIKIFTIIGKINVSI